jgi:uncharacterized membrane protein YfcA
MELNLTMFLLVCPLAFLAGFIDAIAGGGGLISIQAYMLTGLFGVAGGYLGAGMVIKKGGKAIRAGILTVLGLLFVKTIRDIFFV